MRCGMQARLGAMISSPPRDPIAMKGAASGSRVPPNQRPAGLLLLGQKNYASSPSIGTPAGTYSEASIGLITNEPVSRFVRSGSHAAKSNKSCGRAILWGNGCLSLASEVVLKTTLELWRLG